MNRDRRVEWEEVVKEEEEDKRIELKRERKMPEERRKRWNIGGIERRKNY